MLQFFVQQVETVETIVGAYPKAVGVLARNAHGRTIIQTVLAKQADPAVSLNVETAHAHGGGHIHSFLVGRYRQLRYVVVGDAVDAGRFGCTLSHDVGGELVGLLVEHEQSVAHGGHPEAVAVVNVNVENADVGRREGVAVIRFAGRVNPSAALVVRACPDAPRAVFGNGQYGGGEILLVVFDELHLLVETVESVLVGANP